MNLWALDYGQDEAKLYIAARLALTRLPNDLRNQIEPGLQMFQPIHDAYTKARDMQTAALRDEILEHRVESVMEGGVREWVYDVIWSGYGGLEDAQAQELAVFADDYAESGVPQFRDWRERYPLIAEFHPKKEVNS